MSTFPQQIIPKMDLQPENRYLLFNKTILILVVFPVWVAHMKDINAKPNSVLWLPYKPYIYIYRNYLKHSLQTRLVMDINDTLPICASNETDCDNSTIEDNDQCSEPFPSYVPPTVDYVQAAITIIIIALSITINSMIIYLIARFKQLRQ